MVIDDRSSPRSARRGPRLRLAGYRSLGAILAAILTFGRLAIAHSPPEPEHAASLGTVDFPVTCSEPARLEFNRAVALLHHMTYPAARDAFARVVEIDPHCAMANWGIAMTLFQPLWPTRPGPEALRRGWELVRQAKTLGLPTEREQLFVGAVEAFFLEPGSTDYWLRIRRWERASAALYEAFPDDTEAAAFFALSHLAVAPAGALSHENSERAAAILMRIYERNPDHPGAMHYLIHANDVPGRERISSEITHKYEAVAPRNPHALHMPTHLYTRSGDWNGVIRGNLLAAQAALEQPAGDRGDLIWDEFAHATEYLVYAYLQKGDDAAAAAEIERLHGTARLEKTFKTAFHLASTRARFALERHAWREAASTIPREPATLEWDRFAWAEAISWFARGLGAAHIDALDAARDAAAHLEGLEASTRQTGEDLFARNIEILRLELNAWLAHAECRPEAAVALMQRAADLEVSTPKHAVTPAPTIPGHELLGDLFMEQQAPTRALAAYRRAIESYPGRFNSLLGAARAARAVGERSSAEGYYRELLRSAAGGTRQPALQEAADY